VEDITSHHRKGIAGDWRYYFSERVKEAFKDQWADLMIATGYETRMDW
jgi:lipopolysaccharide transport system ATP-binding protein